MMTSLYKQCGGEMPHVKEIHEATLLWEVGHVLERTLLTSNRLVRDEVYGGRKRTREGECMARTSAAPLPAGPSCTTRKRGRRRVIGVLKAQRLCAVGGEHGVLAENRSSCARPLGCADAMDGPMFKV